MSVPFADWPNADYQALCRRFPERLVTNPATGRAQIGRVCRHCGAAFLDMLGAYSHNCPAPAWSSPKPPPWLDRWGNREEPNL